MIGYGCFASGAKVC